MERRRPSHTDLNPVALRFSDDVKFENPIVLRHGQVHKILSASPLYLTQDHAIFKAQYMGQDVLLRRTPVLAHSRAIKIFELHKRLDSLGAPVVPLLEAPVRIGWYSYSVQPYIEHRLYIGTLADLNAISISLQTLSHAFSKLPAEFTPVDHIVDTWLNGVDALAAQEPEYGKSHEIVRDLKSMGGMAHNDIHPRNALFTTNGEVIIIDFEEAITHESNAFFDQHAAIERFVLAPHTADIDINQALNLLWPDSGLNHLALYKAVGSLKNAFNISLARAGGLNDELAKFEYIRRLWLKL